MNRQTWIAGGALTAWIGLAWLVPWASLALALALLLATAGWNLGRLVVSALPPARRAHPFQRREPFVSVHVPAHQEPPEVVLETVRALARQRYHRFEVIVLDNNTSEPELWKPVQRECRELGTRFRFYHFDDVRGAKAGALNLCLELCDPRTDLILVLDADYVASPDLLAEGAAHFEPDIALVQFPQAYRNLIHDPGVELEYEHFFTLYMEMANRADSVLSTGTVAFVRRPALEAVGGWSGETLTEDAELGLRLHRAGYRGRYVGRVLARGLMPTDPDSYAAQRRRWILGNAQSLRQLLRHRGLGWRRCLAILLQLTAWANPLLIPAAALVSAPLLLVNGRPEDLTCLELAGATVSLHFAACLTLFVMAARRSGRGLGAALSAFTIHLAQTWAGAVHPVEALAGDCGGFVRTDKFLRARADRQGRRRVAAVLLVVAAGWLGLLAQQQLWWALGGSLWLLGIGVARAHFCRCLDAVRESTLRLRLASAMPRPSSLSPRYETSRTA